MTPPRKPSAGPTSTWAVYRLRHKAELVGRVQATDEADAIEKAIEQFDIRPAFRARLMAKRED